MNKEGRIPLSAIIVIIVAVLMCLVIVDSAGQEVIGYKEVPCYDQHNNELNDVTCKEEIYSCGLIEKKFGCEGESIMRGFLG